MTDTCVQPQTVTSVTVVTCSPFVKRARVCVYVRVRFFALASGHHTSQPPPSPASEALDPSSDPTLTPTKKAKIEVQEVSVRYSLGCV